MEHTSSESNVRLAARDIGILLAAAVLGAAIYLLTSAMTYRIGFPLDDSWIHLTYARNLAENGEWAFQAGRLSAGSTAPLWTLLLALGFWLHLGPYVWTYLLGEITLLGLAILCEYTARRLSPSYNARLPWIGLFFIAEWHFQWAALSGMETLLQGLIMTAVLAWLVMGTRRYLTLGLLTGISIWVRPDGLTLLGPVILTILLIEKNLPDRGSAIGAYLIGFGALFVPYLAFSLWLSDTPMPNTFYAKQAEYAAWQAQPILYRISVLLVQVLTGPSVILMPGMIAAVVLSVRRRAWALLAALTWSFGYLLVYILRLPAYQHGRYLMPAMPFLFLAALLVYLELPKPSLRAGWARIGQTVGRVSLGVLTIAFVVLGARSYGQDVGLIESEMVVTAKWISANIPAQSVVAAHDIGALGYFDHHPLIDLAGLVSPEVIPFIRDESRLATFMNHRHADYLVAFPAFYPTLTEGAVPVFTSGGPFAPEIGEKNMTVYLWRRP